MYPKPSAPPLVDLLKEDEPSVVCNYNCEDGCDVEFLVGTCDEDLIRIPVHSRKLSEYPVFKAMLSEDYTATYIVCDQRKLRQIRVNWIDRKAFDNVMKFIYREPVNLQAPEMTVETLKAAHEFLLPGLVRACVKQLSQMISLSNVLFIFANVRYLCNDMENLEELVQSGIHMPMPKRRKHSFFNQSKNSQTTGNPKTDETQDANHLSAGLEMKNLCLWLLCQCVDFFDVHAVHVLESDEMEELDSSYVRFLLKRDSLDVSELAIFSALVRWAETECKRQHLPLTRESKRLVLHDLIYVVRFFQMTASDFTSGPGDSGLLSPVEVELINSVLHHGGRPHFSTVTTASGQTKRNLCCPLTAFNKQQIQSVEELQALKTHWRYLWQPRNPKLNNGDIGNGDGNDRRGSRDNGKKRRKYSLEGSPKKSLMKFKRIGLLVKNFCIPCAFRRNDFGKTVVLMNNGQRKSASSQQNLFQENDDNKYERPMQRRESKLSKAFDYSLRAFAFFFD